MFTLRRGIVYLAFAAVAAAGDIAGTVYDPSGAVVPNASVTVQPLDGTTASLNATTDPKGDYFFTALAAGRYRVEVSSPGFTLSRQGCALPDSGASTRLDVVLRLGAIQETVRVERETGGAPPPQTGPRRVRVGGSVQPAKIVAGLRPAYPAGTQASGRVLIHGVVLRDGTVGNVNVIASPDAELAVAASDAVRQTRYQPTLLNGQPVETETLIAIDYQTK